VDYRKILFMSILSYMLTPALASLVKIYYPWLPSALFLLIPLVIWSLLSKSIVKKLNTPKRVAITLLGYCLFLLFNFIGIQNYISLVLGM
jgi:uncharacterized protein YqgC (DUF456 family)